MIDVTDNKSNLTRIQNFVEAARKSPLYAQAQRDFDLSDKYVSGDQAPEHYKSNPNVPILIINTLSGDIIRSAGIITNGRVSARFYPKDELSKALVPVMIAENHSWQYQVDFKSKLGALAQSMLTYGISAAITSIDPFVRVGDDLPKIPIQIADPRALLVDPLSNNPHDPLLGGSFVCHYDIKTYEQLEAEYGLYDEYKTQFKKIDNIVAEPAKGSKQKFDILHPLREILRRLGENKDSEQEEEEIKGDRQYLTLTCIWRDYYSYKDEDGDDVVRKCWVRGFCVTDITDVELKNAVLLETSVLNYEDMPTIILACAKPPYGVSIPKLAHGGIDALNISRSAALAMVLQMIRNGMKMAIIEQAWSPEQLAAFKSGKDIPDLFLMDGKELIERGVMPDAGKLVSPINRESPNIRDVLEFASVLEKKNEEVLGTPWVVRGQANASSRFSGAAISMMQDAVKLGHEMTATVIGRVATDCIRLAWGMQKQHWGSYHNIMNPGITGLIVNGLIADPEKANQIMLNGSADPERPLVLTGIRVKTKAENPANKYQTYPVTPDIEHVMLDPMLLWLSKRDDVEEIMWVVNGLSNMTAEVDVLIELDSLQKDQENYAKFQAVMSLNPQLLAEEVQYDLVMGGEPKVSWKENQEMRYRGTALAQLAQMPPDQLEQVLQVAQQMAAQGQQQAQPEIQQGAAPGVPATAPVTQ